MLCKSVSQEFVLVPFFIVNHDLFLSASADTDHKYSLSSLYWFTVYLYVPIKQTPAGVCHLFPDLTAVIASGSFFSL